MNPAPFVHSALAMTGRLKRRDRCPALAGWPWLAPVDKLHEDMDKQMKGKTT
jgi:hypothetical protein